MCLLTASCAEGIYGVLESKLAQLLQCDDPWKLCTSVGVDNTSVNIGIRNSLKTRILQCNSAIFLMAVPAT